MKQYRINMFLPFAVFAAVAFFICLRVPVYAAPDISAPIAVVMDFHTGEILYERNMERRHVPASITKSVTAFIVYQEMEAGRLTLDTRIPVSVSAAAFSSDRRQQGSYVPLNAREYITVEVLLQLLMLPSANAAAVVFAEYISGTEEAFVERMNETVAEMGMYSSFTNSHGALPHYTNAYSMAVFMREFIIRYPDILRITQMTHVYFNGTRYNNTNQLLSTVPFRGTDGFKTGSLRQAGWNHSVTAERDGRRIIAVVMNTSSRAACHAYARTLLAFGFEELNRRETERAERVRIFLGGSLFPLDQVPLIKHGMIHLPLRAVFERLGYRVEWHKNHGLVQLEREKDEAITLFVGRDLAIINGNVYIMDTPAQTIDGRIFVSKGFIAHATGTTVAWDMDTGVILFSGGS
jgi:D-alanyl-D-alanine carboxypeptidase